MPGVTPSRTLPGVGSGGSKLVSRWPNLARQLRTALLADHEVELAEQVDELQIVAVCRCDDDFCQSFYTQPPPEGSYPYDEGRARSVVLSPGWEGYLNLDVVDERIACVEVLYRPPLD